MAKKSAATAAPQSVQQQLAALVRSTGREDLDVDVKVRPDSAHTCVDLDGIAAGVPATILLGTHDIDISAEELHTVLGHELAHVIRRRDGLSEFGVPSALLRRTGLQTFTVFTVGILGGFALILWSALHNSIFVGLVGFAVMMCSIPLSLAISSRPRRDDETATDILAAELGAVLTLDDVQRFRDIEGWLARHTPTIFRDHLKPEQRREIQLAAHPASPAG